MNKYIWINRQLMPGYIISIYNSSDGGRITYSNIGKGLSIEGAINVNPNKHSLKIKYELYEVEVLRDYQFKIVSKLSKEQIKKLETLI